MAAAKGNTVKKEVCSARMKRRCVLSADNIVVSLANPADKKYFYKVAAGSTNEYLLYFDEYSTH